MPHALILIYTHSSSPPPVQVSNSHQSEIERICFCSTIHLICFFQPLVDIIWRDDIHKSYSCLLENNLKIFTQCMKNAILSGSRLAFTCLRIQEDVDSHWCISCPSLWGAKNAQMGGSHIATTHLAISGGRPSPSWRLKTHIWYYWLANSEGGVNRAGLKSA